MSADVWGQLLFSGHWGIHPLVSSSSQTPLELHFLVLFPVKPLSQTCSTVVSADVCGQLLFAGHLGIQPLVSSSSHVP